MQLDMEKEQLQGGVTSISHFPNFCPTPPPISSLFTPMRREGGSIHCSNLPELISN